MHNNYLILMLFYILSVIVYIYILLNIGKDMFLNTSKSEKEQKRRFIKFFLPTCIIIAFGFLLINIYVFPYLLEVLN